MTASKSRIAFLDYLRALAIVPVLLTHNRAILTPGGFLGVDVFFVLSGYFITLLLARDLPIRLNLGSFFVRRMCRILPLYYLTLIAYLLLVVFIGGQELSGVHNLPSAFLMLGPPTLENYRMGFYWTLQVEFWFYLIFPVAYFLGNNSHSRNIIFSGLICVSLYYSFSPGAKQQLQGHLPPALALLIIHAGEFLIGCLVANVKNSALNVQKTLAISLFVFSLCTILFLYINPAGYDLQGHHESFYRYAISCATGLIIVAWASGHLNWVVLPGLSYVGLISYSLYLLHLPLMEFMSFTELPGKELAKYFPSVVFSRGLDFSSIVHYLLICSLVAAITYLFIEKPSIRFGRHWSLVIEQRNTLLRNDRNK